MEVIAEILQKILNWLGLFIIYLKILVNGGLLDSHMAAMAKCIFLNCLQFELCLS